MSDYIFGMDISRHQYDEGLTHKFDFRKAYAAGVRFCASRATVGDYYTDLTLERNVKGSQDAGIIPLAYHVPAYHDGSANERKIKPADAIGRFLDAVGPLGIDDEAHVLDCEIVRGGAVKSGAQYKAEGVELLRHVKDFTWYSNANVGDTVMVGFASFWRKHFGWIANYTQAAKPALPKWLDDWHCWQYTSTARGSDYGAWSKSIDLNRMKAEMWQAITGQAVEPEPEPEPPAVKIVVPETLTATVDGVTYTWRLA